MGCGGQRGTTVPQLGGGQRGYTSQSRGPPVCVPTSRGPASEDRSRICSMRAMFQEEDSGRGPEGRILEAEGHTVPSDRLLRPETCVPLCAPVCPCPVVTQGPAPGHLWAHLHGSRAPGWHVVLAPLGPSPASVPSRPKESSTCQPSALYRGFSANSP